MPFTVILHIYRKPGVTSIAFKSYIESHYIYLIQSLAGAYFPLSHKRFYL